MVDSSLENSAPIFSLSPLIADFFVSVEKSSIDLYNEFSLQHELGIYLRNALPDYRVQFERNISFFIREKDTVKKEIDISIFDANKEKRYAIELKFPLNGQHPEQLYSFVKDIKFMEQLKNYGFSHTYCVSLVADKLFYSGNNKSGIYGYFRDMHKVFGRIYKPTGKDKNHKFIELDGEYDFNWKPLPLNRKYYCIEI